MKAKPLYSAPLLRGFTLLFCLGSLACSNTTGHSQEYLPLESGTLEYAPADLSKLTESYGKAIQLAEALQEPCKALLDGELGKIKQQRQKLVDGCFFPLDESVRELAPFTGRHFRVDEYLSSWARLHDSLRILIWRLKYESSDEVCREGIEKTTMAWNNLQKIGNSFSPEEGLDPLVEEQILGAPSALLARFLASDQGTTGLLFEQATRTLYMQGTNPNNVRDRTLQHKLSVADARLKIRISVLMQKVNAEEAPKDLGPRLLDYAERTFLLTAGIRNHLAESLKQGKQPKEKMIQWRGEAGALFLNWANAYEALHSDFGQ